MESLCCICHETLLSDRPTVIVKHWNDADITEARNRGHYFHKTCIDDWKKEAEGFPCPLDRDPIIRVQNVMSYEISGFNIGFYNHDYCVALCTLKTIPDKLLQNLTDVNEVDKNNKTLAYYACRIGNMSLVEKLLRKDADFNRPTGDNCFTPLMVAVCYNHLEIVRRLLRHKVTRAGCNTMDMQGRTAFSYACEYKYAKIIAEFLDHKLVNPEEVKHMMNIYKEKYYRDRMFGYEILDMMLHYQK